METTSGDTIGEGCELHTGDHVASMEDGWDLLGDDFVVVDAEPVPGSTQCLIQGGGETYTVSRCTLRVVR